MRLAATVLAPRDDDRQLAAVEPGPRGANLEGAGQAHRSGKPTELALDEMVGAGGIAGGLGSGNEHDAVAKHHAQRVGRYAGDIEDDLDAGARLEHVEDRMALARVHLLVRGDVGLDIGEQRPDVVPQFTKVAGSA